jgi:thioredoxin reductase (NADPH)
MSAAKSSPDVIVIGAGPAGLSAAAWCSELHLRTVLLDRAEDVGGQLNSIYNPINNYLGLAAANGSELLSNIRNSVALCGFERRTGTEVVGIDGRSRTANLAGGETISAKVLILATGVRRRQLHIRNETELAGKGVLESGVRDRGKVIGRRVVIVGGGDAAVENALLLSEAAESIKVIHRRARPTARSEFLDQAALKANIEFIANTVLTEIVGESFVEGVEVEHLPDGTRRREPAEAVLVRIGVQPNSEVFAKALDLDDAGYVKVNSLGETSHPGIYAVGDLANPVALSISTATGTGATAAKAAYRFLNPS